MHGEGNGHGRDARTKGVQEGEGIRVKEEVLQVEEEEEVDRDGG